MGNFDGTARVNDWPIKFSSQLTDGWPAVLRPTNDLMTGIRHLRGSSFSPLSSCIVVSSFSSSPSGRAASA